MTGKKIQNSTNNDGLRHVSKTTVDDKGDLPSETKRCPPSWNRLYRSEHLHECAGLRVQSLCLWDLLEQLCGASSSCSLSAGELIWLDRWVIL